MASNPTQQKKSHGLVTDPCHIKQPGLRQFYQKALNICQTEKRPFSKMDFPDLTGSNYRKIIQKLKPHLELVTNGRPKLWKVKGTILAGYSHSVTEMATEGSSAFEKLLESLKDQPPMIHDIHLKFESDLHAKLVSTGLSVNSSNHAITDIKYDSLDKNFNTKIMIYPKTTLIILGCTYNPIIYNIDGIYSLMIHLGQVQFYLSYLAKHEVILPKVQTWIVTRYDFNKDGSESSNVHPFWREWDDIATGLIRFYLKTMQDGRKIPRLEQIQSPNKPLSQILVDVISQR